MQPGLTEAHFYQVTLCNAKCSCDITTCNSRHSNI